MKLSFDHCYTNDSNHQFLKKLQKAGFKLDERMVEHPGKAFCRFIALPETPNRGRQYLEFVHVGKGGDLSNPTPGISLRGTQPLEPFCKKLISKKIKARFAHKNYDWKKNSKDRLPGWNLILFKLRSGIFTWITEYEKSKKRKLKSTKNLKHPNGVYAIQEIDVNLSSKDLQFYTKLLGKPKIDKFHLKCGTTLKFTKSIGRSQIKSILLLTNDLKKLVQKFQWDELTIYDGRPGVVIKSLDKMWDVIIIQKR